MGKYSPLVRLGTATAARVVKAGVVGLYALTGAIVGGGAMPLTCVVSVNSCGGGGEGGLWCGLDRQVRPFLGVFFSTRNQYFASPLRQKRKEEVNQRRTSMSQKVTSQSNKKV